MTGSRITLLLVCAGSMSTTTLATDACWTVTAGPNTNIAPPSEVVFVPMSLRHQPRLRNRLALEPPRVDPWMPRAALVALPPAWPAKLRRFRGDV